MIVVTSVATLPRASRHLASGVGGHYIHCNRFYDLAACVATSGLAVVGVHDRL